MTVETPDPIEAQAIAWHIRLRHGDDEAWARFVAWLEADPRHRAAYDRIEAADRALEEVLPGLTFREGANDDGANDDRANDDGAPAWWRRRLGKGPIAGALIAASLVAALMLAPRLASGRYEVGTGPGEHRLIALDADTKVELNGSTRMIFDRKDPRFAALETGEALFHIRHDAARPFMLDMGAGRLVDLGTVFDVVRDGGGIRLAVAQGKVAYRAAGQEVRVGAGQGLTDLAGDTAIRLVSAPAGSVGGWRNGRLVYDGTPLEQVARDVGRTLGLRIAVAPALAARPISGTILLHGKGPDEARRLGAVLDVAVVAGPDGWTMRPTDGPTDGVAR